MKKLIENLKSVNKFGLILILLAAGLIFTQSAFKGSTKKTSTTYHIVADLGDRWEVTEDGSCGLGGNPCSFQSSLTPDDGMLYKDDLEDETPGYENLIVQGTYTP